jgi:hypothetical protein
MPAVSRSSVQRALDAHIKSMKPVGDRIQPRYGNSQQSSHSPPPSRKHTVSSSPHRRKHALTLSPTGQVVEDPNSYLPPPETLPPPSMRSLSHSPVKSRQAEKREEPFQPSGAPASYRMQQTARTWKHRYRDADHEAVAEQQASQPQRASLSPRPSRMQYTARPQQQPSMSPPHQPQPRHASESPSHDNADLVIAQQREARRIAAAPSARPAGAHHREQARGRSSSRNLEPAPVHEARREMHRPRNVTFGGPNQPLEQTIPFHYDAANPSAVDMNGDEPSHTAAAAASAASASLPSASQSTTYSLSLRGGSTQQRGSSSTALSHRPLFQSSGRTQRADSAQTNPHKGAGSHPPPVYRHPSLYRSTATPRPNLDGEDSVKESAYELVDTRQLDSLNSSTSNVGSLTVAVPRATATQPAVQEFQDKARSLSRNPTSPVPERAVQRDEHGRADRAYNPPMHSDRDIYATDKSHGLSDAFIVGTEREQEIQEDRSRNALSTKNSEGSHFDEKGRPIGLAGYVAPSWTMSAISNGTISRHVSIFSHHTGKIKAKKDKLGLNDSVSLGPQTPVVREDLSLVIELR